MPTAYPPHANAALVTTSNAIQSPSGYPSFSAVVAPSPATSRHAIRTAPTANSVASTRVAGVTSGPPTGSARIVVLRVCRVLQPAIPPHHEAEHAVQGERRGETAVHTVLDRSRQIRRGFHPERRQPQLVERQI